MYRSVIVTIVLASALALSACGTQQAQPDAAEQTASPTVPAAADAPPAAFAQCRTCHSLEPGRAMIGPSLHGVVGKPAASAPGFAYSNALKASGLTWDEKTLDAWLAGPNKLVPGSKMIFTGIADAAKRKQVIDYLATQK
jgi:cytochrome c